MSEVPHSFQLAADWSAADGLPVKPVNQMVATLAPSSATGVPDGVLLYMGNTVPPVVLGGDEQMMAVIQSMGGMIPVDAHGRFIMARERAQELVDILQNTIRQYDAAIEEARANHA